MPEPTFLQIQGRGEATMRMLELPPGPVRIGRGPYCEVRLGDPGLGDVQCMLRRRGATWHFQPVGPAGHVWIDGRAADQQRPIPLGVPFRVGEHWLILRPADSATNDWGSFDAPISVDARPRAEAEVGHEPEPEPGPTLAIATTAGLADGQPRSRPAASPSDDTNEERLRRWEARLEQRERWLKDRQDERRWEARWKSAGESIRARSTPPAATPGTPPRTPTPTPTPPPASNPRPTSRPSQTPPVARIIEPKGAEPIRRGADPAPRPSTPRVVVRPLPDPPAPIRRPVAPPPARVEVRPIEAERHGPPIVRPGPPQAPPSRALVALAPAPSPIVVPAETPVQSRPAVAPGPAPAEVEEVAAGGLIGVEVGDDAPDGRIHPRVHPAILAPSQPSPLEDRGPLFLPSPPGLTDCPISTAGTGQSSSPLPLGEVPGVRGADSPVAREDGPSWGSLGVPRPSPRPSPRGRGRKKDGPGAAETAQAPEIASDQKVGIQAPPPAVAQEPEPDRPPGASALIESSGWLEDVLPTAIEEARRAEIEIAPPAADRPSARPEIAPASPAERPAAGLPREAGPTRGEWPSARAIFEAQGRRAGPGPAAPKTGRRKAAEPEPTEVQGPPCWSMPLWLGWFPALVVAAMVGAGGIALALEWAIGANNADSAIKLAARPEGAPGSPIDAALIPRGGWWTSTATHQAAWAMALARSGDGEDHSEEIRSLLDSSRNASRLASRSRFVVELPEATAPGSPPDLSHLGRTRDVVPLVWTGRRLRKEGKPGAAIRAFRSAMEIASKASLEDLDPPAFFEDPQVRRYALPREALLGFAARAMAEDGEWTPEQWAEALPPSAAASMVASRVFAKLGKRADAGRLADLAIRQAEAPTPPGYDPAEGRAAGAEALAYRHRWPEAAAQYRRAIDEAEDDATRRMWWLNLAEVAQRTGDDAARARAIEAAKAQSSVDEVTRRALKYQQSLPGLASTGSRP